MDGVRYALITAARNEASFIEGTIKSVISQTQKPISWVIVNDGSTDGTDEIVKRYMKDCSFIRLVSKMENRLDGFGSKVEALRMAYDYLKPLVFEFIGNLDADLTVEHDYYEKIIRKFEEDSKLGVAGGLVYDVWNGKKNQRSPDKKNYVCGGLQLFRRACFEGIGGYLPVKEGGEDTVASVMARMAGWRVVMFPEHTALHHKEGARTRGSLGDHFREGVMDYILGSYVVFELGKCILRMRRRPYLVGGIARTLGFLWAWVYRRERVVSEDFIKFLREEEKVRMRDALRFWKTINPEAYKATIGNVPK